MIIPVPSGGGYSPLTLVATVYTLILATIAVYWYWRDRTSARAELRRGMDEIKALVEDAKRMVPQTPEAWAELETKISPIVDKMLIHATDQVLQKVGPIIDERMEAAVQGIGGMIAGSIGQLLALKQQGETAELINAPDGPREKGLKTRKLQGFSNQAARLLAGELDPSGGVISGKLLDLAERYGIDPQEAVEAGMKIMEKYPDIAAKLAPGLKKVGHAVKEKATGVVSNSSGGGWG